MWIRYGSPAGTAAEYNLLPTLENHTLGESWFDPADDRGAARALPSGKGGRYVMLCAITKEFGMLGRNLWVGEERVAGVSNDALDHV